MIQIIKKLRVLLDKKQKRTMVGLIILMVISAFLQTAGVGMLVEVCTDPGTVTAVIRQRGFPVCHQLLLYFQRYHDDPDGGGIASVDVADQESAEAHHVQGR